MFWGCRPSVPSTGTELGAGSVGLGARYCRVLRALGWAGATPPAYAARVWGLWAGGCRMCEAVLSVERGRMHVGLLTVGVPVLTAHTALTVPGASVASLPDDAWLGVGLGSVKPLGLVLGLELRLGLGLGLGLDRCSWVVVGDGLDSGSAWSGLASSGLSSVGLVLSGLVLSVAW